MTTVSPSTFNGKTYYTNTFDDIIFRFFVGGDIYIESESIDEKLTILQKLLEYAKENRNTIITKQCKTILEEMILTAKEKSSHLSIIRLFSKYDLFDIDIDQLLNNLEIIRDEYEDWIDKLHKFLWEKPCLSMEEALTSSELYHLVFVKFCPNISTFNTQTTRKDINNLGDYLIPFLQEIKHLSIKSFLFNYYDITDNEIACVISLFPHITTLSLKKVAISSEEPVLKYIFEHPIPTLTDLDLSFNKVITDTSMCHLSACFVNLVAIKLVGCSITDESLQSLSLNCLKIKYIDLSLCDNITNRGLICLFKKCQSLYKIILIDCRDTPSITDETITDVLPLADNLRHINLTSKLITDEALNFIFSHVCSRLRTISLNTSPEVTDAAFKNLSKQKANFHFKDITLSECKNLTVTTLRRLSFCKNLETLTMQNTYHITVDDIKKFLQHSLKITKITFIRCKNLDHKALKTLEEQLNSAGREITIEIS